jgi:hypothetical protein
MFCCIFKWLLKAIDIYHVRRKVRVSDLFLARRTLIPTIGMICLPRENYRRLRLFLAETKCFKCMLAYSSSSSVICSV